jgi:hypothetical protein
VKWADTQWRRLTAWAGPHLKRSTTWFAVGFLGLAGLCAWLYGLTGATGKAWLPAIAVGLATLALTITFVDWIVRREKSVSERPRVVQALNRLSGQLYALGDFVLHDYGAMHPGDSYEEPPRSLRGLLKLFADGLDTRETAWPDHPLFLGGTESLSRHLGEQIDRHGSVLDHGFIAAAYRFRTSELMSRNKYLDPRDHYGQDDGWKTDALRGLVGDLERYLDVYEPYARRYLGRDWKVELSEHAIAAAIRSHDLRLDAEKYGPA